MKDGVNLDNVSSIKANVIEGEINVVVFINLTNSQFAKVLDTVQSWGDLKFIFNQ